MANINNKDSAFEIVNQLIVCIEHKIETANKNLDMYSKDMQMYKEEFPSLYKLALEDYNYNLGRHQLAVEMRNEVLQAFANIL